MRKWKYLSKGDKIFRIIYICFWIILVIYGIYKYNYDAKVLKNYKITTATVTGIFYGPKHDTVRLEYEINGIKYEQEKTIFPDDCRLWDQYKMKYAVEDPDVIEVLWDKKIE